MQSRDKVSGGERLFLVDEAGGEGSGPLDHEGGPGFSADSLTCVSGQLRMFRDERDWHEFHTPRNLAVSIAIESGELLEHFQWLSGEEDVREVVSHEGVAEELADVVIYAIQLADVLGLSLSEAVQQKIQINEQRYPARLAKGSREKQPGLITKEAS